MVLFQKTLKTAMYIYSLLNMTITEYTGSGCTLSDSVHPVLSLVFCSVVLVISILFNEYWPPRPGPRPVLNMHIWWNPAPARFKKKINPVKSYTQVANFQKWSSFFIHTVYVRHVFGFTCTMSDGAGDVHEQCWVRSG